jgi:hypothetical protein
MDCEIADQEGFAVGRVVAIEMGDDVMGLVADGQAALGFVATAAQGS